jgi:hypothetical protein
MRAMRSFGNEKFNIGLKTEQPEWRRRVSVHSTLRAREKRKALVAVEQQGCERIKVQWE